jgi:hypothetical protein
LAAKTLLRAKQINHGQSEIWLQADGKELTPHRTLATNEVVNVVRRTTSEDVFKAFYAEYHIALEHIASLDVPNLDAIATELKLRA